MLFKNFRNTLKLLSTAEKKNYIYISFFTLFSNFFEIISIGSIPIYISFIFDPSIIQKYLNKLDIEILYNYFERDFLIIYVSITLIGIFFIKNIIICSLYYFNLSFIQKLNIRIGNQIFLNNLSSPFLLYINKSPAELIRDHGAIRSFSNILGHYQRLFLELTLLCLILIASLNLFFKVTVLFLFIFLTCFLVFYFTFRNYLKSSGENIQKYKKKELSLLENSFTAIKEIKIYLKERLFLERFKKNYYALNKIILFNQLLSKLPKIFLELIAVIVIVFVTYHFFNSNMSEAEKISSISLFVIIAVRLIPAFTGISIAISQIKHSEPTIDIVARNLLNSYKNFNNDNLIPERIDKINLENINFSFDGKNNLYSENINLSVKRGDHIGIRGTSGSGKTTLINILTGLIKPSTGQLIINSNSVNEEKLIKYTRYLSYVPQDTILFNDTIKNNLVFYDLNINVDKLKLVTNMCELDQYISNLTLDINTNIGEKGLKISGGQKQRIGIARALYRDFDVLILDEATSSLNKEYESKILKKIFDFYKNKIIILISHDQNALKYCNKIIDIKKSKN